MITVAVTTAGSGGEGRGIFGACLTTYAIHRVEPRVMAPDVGRRGVGGWFLFNIHHVIDRSTRTILCALVSCRVVPFVVLGSRKIAFRPS